MEGLAMLILLPPSETKRAGGRAHPLEIDALALPQLAPQREEVVGALVALCADPDTAARVLKLSERQRGEIADNAALRTAPTLPAADRYTGVLFDALDASSLAAPARRWLGAHVMIQSAPFGLVAALDPIPAYRLSAGTALPGVAALRRIWSDATTAALAEAAPRFVLDLRSEAYAALGPVPETGPRGIRSAYLRVVTAGEDGSVRALNHFNKHAKGALVRRLAEERPRVSSAEGLLTWAAGAGIEMRAGAPGEVDLIV